MFKIYDGREHFYQWDLDRKLIVEDPSINEVHFCNRTDNCSLVCETYVEDGITLVNVPNIILQTDWKIHVYAYDGKHTKHDECYEVKSRTKPADYVYTETEVKEWERVVEIANDAVEEAGKATEAVTKMAQELKDTTDATNSAIKSANDAIGEIADDYANKIVVSASGVGIDIRDSADRAIEGLTVYGKTTQKATPSLDKPQEFQHGDITVEQYYTFNKINISIPGGLAGVPILKQNVFGHYTDSKGQKWIADVYDTNTRKHTQYIETRVIGEDRKFAVSGLDTYEGYYYFYCYIGKTADLNIDGLLCDKFLTKHYSTAWTDNSPGEFCTVKPSNDGLGAVFCVNILKTRVNKYPGNTILEKFTNLIKENPLTIQIAHNSAISTTYIDLTEEAKEQCKNFKIRAKYTKVYNDIDSYMKIEYIVDTQTYIDNKFNELRKAILSMGGNV